MKPVRLLAALAMFLVLLPSGVFSTDFAVSVAPASLSATTSTLLNFTVTNLNSTYNITQVNITLPGGFSYGSNTGTTVADPLVQKSATIFTNTTPVGIIQSGAAQYFWFNASASVISPPTYTITVYTLDGSGAGFTNTTSVTVSDVTPPAYISNSTTPTSPVTYALGMNYTFNITWSDNIGISTVIFNWNGANETVTAYATGKYSVTKTDLASAVYTYQWYANDTSGGSNTTGSLSFNVSQAINSIDMYLNGELNRNILLANGTLLNVTAATKAPSNGNIYLFKNNAEIVASPGAATLSCTSTCTQPLAINTTYTFLANATGNANYTANSTGASYAVSVIYPPPRYSISTSIPSVYTTTAATWSVSWYDQNDPNAFNASYLELNYTGTATNYTMSRTSGTNTSTYSIALPAGAYYWKLWGSNSYGSWNYTGQNAFTIDKTTPSITVTVTPAYQVFNYTQINASCSVTTTEVALSLYKNSTSVSNPYVASLPTGYYRFDCNNTATQNQTASSATQYLTVLGYSVYFDVTTPPSFIYLLENSTNTTSITVRNGGTETQTVSFAIEGLNASMWNASSGNVTLTRDSSGVFLVTFSSAANITDYSGVFKAYNANRTVTSNFTLRVMPNEKTKANINSTIADYIRQIAGIEKAISESKADNINTTAAESALSQFRSKLDQAQGYLNGSDYFNAYQTMAQAKPLLESAKGEMAKISQVSVGKLVDILMIAVPVAIAVAVLIYLLMPPSKSSYSLKSGYKLAVPKENALKKLIERLSRKEGLKKALEPKEKEVKETLEIKDKEDGKKE